MVGDGINDAPCTVQSAYWFCYGAMGTDTAIETADVALMDDDLNKIPAFVRLSRATRSILVQNISMALIIKKCVPDPNLSGFGHHVDGRICGCMGPACWLSEMACGYFVNKVNVQVAISPQWPVI